MAQNTEWNSELEKEFFTCSSINGPGWNAFNSTSEFTIGIMNHRIPEEWRCKTYKSHFSPEFTTHIQQKSGTKTFNVDVNYGGNVAYLGRDEIHQVASVVDSILESGVDVYLQHCFNVVYYAKDYPRIKYSRIQSEMKMIDSIRERIALYSNTKLDELPVLFEHFSEEQKLGLEKAYQNMPIRYFATWNWLTEDGRRMVSSFLKVGDIKDPWKDIKPFWEWERFQEMSGEIETLFV